MNDPKGYVVMLTGKVCKTWVVTDFAEAGKFVEMAVRRGYNCRAEAVCPQPITCNEMMADLIMLELDQIDSSKC